MNTSSKKTKEKKAPKARFAEMNTSSKKTKETKDLQVIDSSGKPKFKRTTTVKFNSNLALNYVGSKTGRSQWHLHPKLSKAMRKRLHQPPEKKKVTGNITSFKKCGHILVMRAANIWSRAGSVGDGSCYDDDWKDGRRLTTGEKIHGEIIRTRDRINWRMNDIITKWSIHNHVNIAEEADMTDPESTVDLRIAKSECGHFPSGLGFYLCSEHLYNKALEPYLGTVYDVIATVKDHAVKDMLLCFLDDFKVKRDILQNYCNKRSKLIHEVALWMRDFLQDAPMVDKVRPTFEVITEHENRLKECYDRAPASLERLGFLHKMMIYSCLKRFSEAENKFDLLGATSYTRVLAAPDDPEDSVDVRYRLAVRDIMKQIQEARSEKSKLMMCCMEVTLGAINFMVKDKEKEIKQARETVDRNTKALAAHRFKIKEDEKARCAVEKHLRSLRGAAKFGPMWTTSSVEQSMMQTSTTMRADAGTQYCKLHFMPKQSSPGPAPKAQNSPQVVTDDDDDDDDDDDIALHQTLSETALELLRSKQNILEQTVSCMEDVRQRKRSSSMVSLGPVSSARFYAFNQVKMRASGVDQTDSKFSGTALSESYKSYEQVGMSRVVSQLITSKDKLNARDRKPKPKEKAIGEEDEEQLLRFLRNFIDNAMTHLIEMQDTVERLRADAKQAMQRASQREKKVVSLVNHIKVVAEKLEMQKEGFPKAFFTDDAVKLHDYNPLEHTCRFCSCHVFPPGKEVIIETRETARALGLLMGNCSKYTRLHLDVKQKYRVIIKALTDAMLLIHQGLNDLMWEEDSQGVWAKHRSSNHLLVNTLNFIHAMPTNDVENATAKAKKVSMATAMLSERLVVVIRDINSRIQDAKLQDKMLEDMEKEFDKVEDILDISSLQVARLRCRDAYVHTSRVMESCRCVYCRCYNTPFADGLRDFATIKGKEDRLKHHLMQALSFTKQGLNIVQVKSGKSIADNAFTFTTGSVFAAKPEMMEHLTRSTALISGAVDHLNVIVKEHHNKLGLRGSHTRIPSKSNLRSSTRLTPSTSGGLNSLRTASSKSLAPLDAKSLSSVGSSLGSFKSQDLNNSSSVQLKVSSTKAQARSSADNVQPSFLPSITSGWNKTNLWTKPQGRKG